MKKTLKKLSAILTAAIITTSILSTVLASDIEIYQNSDVNIQQNIDKDEDKTEETNGLDEPQTDNISTEEDSIKDTTEYIEDFNGNSGENKTEEKTTEIETLIDNETNINVNIDNGNYFEINNNTGNININIYNQIGVDINSNSGKEADVDVDLSDSISISDTNTKSETENAENFETVSEEEAIEIPETIIAEETIEETTESSRRGGGGGSVKKTYKSSSSSKTSSNINKNNVTKDEITEKDKKNLKEVKTEDVKIEKEKKVVCMTIGSHFMNVDGNAVETDSAPYISENNYTLVPLRCISTVFDAEIDWDNDTKTAIIKADGIETRFKIGSNIMLVNGVSKEIPQPAEIYRSRTYVPLRSLGEALGANVSWIPESKSILVIK